MATHCSTVAWRIPWTKEPGRLQSTELQRVGPDRVIFIFTFFMFMLGFPGGILVKNVFASAGDTGDLGLIPGPGRSHRGGHGNPLQYSCLENLMDRVAWWATAHRVTKIQT